MKPSVLHTFQEVFFFFSFFLFFFFFPQEVFFYNRSHDVFFLASVQCSSQLSVCIQDFPGGS